MSRRRPRSAERAALNHHENGPESRTHSLARWPAGKYDPLTPAGEAEQVDKLLSGLARQTGWRGLVAKTVAAIVLLLIVALIALQVARRFG